MKKNQKSRYISQSDSGVFDFAVVLLLSISLHALYIMQKVQKDQYMIVNKDIPSAYYLKSMVSDIESTEPYQRLLMGMEVVLIQEHL